MANPVAQAGFFNALPDNLGERYLAVRNGRLMAARPGSILSSEWMTSVNGQLQLRVPSANPLIRVQDDGTYLFVPKDDSPPSLVDIGNTNVGPDSSPPSDGRVLISGPFVVPFNCTAVSIFIREFFTGQPGGDLRGVLFADNGSGMPTGSPLAIGNIVNPTGAAAWLESVIAVPVALLAAGPRIHVGYVTQGAYMSAFTHATGSGSMKRYESWAGSGALPALGQDYLSTLSAYVRCTIP